MTNWSDKDSMHEELVSNVIVEKHYATLQI